MMKTKRLARSLGRKSGIIIMMPWDCLRCGECCRRYQVRLDLAEAGPIARRLDLTVEEFRERYADSRWPGDRSLLLRQESGGCPFLDRPDGNGDELCAIHDFKPSSCREWTPGPGRRECQAGLARRWGLVVGPRGEMRGPNGEVGDFRSFIDSLAGDRRT